MNSNYVFKRRKFLQFSTAAMSFMFLPGLGRVKAKPYSIENPADYYGRLCYNENPLGPSPAAMDAMQLSVVTAHRYPDWFSLVLESDIASHHGLLQDNICAGAGATEIIRLIADAFLSAGDEMITATPTYTQMASEAVTNGASVVHVPLDENYVIDLQGILQAVRTNTKLISLVNPNNPLATTIHKTDMESFLNALPAGIIVVVDEAYHHYVQSPDYESCIRFVSEGYPVIVVRTFSKVYGLAGARIGYSVAASHYTNQIASSQLFGMVSNLGQAAAQAALTDTQHLINTISLNNQAKQILEAGFASLNLNYIPSETNFMMFDVGTTAATVVSKLASKGFQVRTGWGMPQHIRVSTGSIVEMQEFITALGNVMGQYNVNTIETPKAFSLNSIYPNPFNNQCNIKITTAGSEKVILTIHNLLGRKVRTLLNSAMISGVHTIFWDGKDVHGEGVASGVYIINLIQGEFAASARATLIK
jgi:histidinol-phosphate aminotransferase